MTWPVVRDCAAALLSGALLKYTETDEPEKAWGVVQCSKALGAFDAYSDAWCGRDGVPHRFTREEAETWARRLSGTSHDGTGYSALEIPARPRIVAAGRAADAVGPLQFECVDWTNGPADVVNSGSAFDAAYAFVGLVGERGAYSALSDLLWVE